MHISAKPDVIVVYICNSCNMGMRALPGMYAQLPEGQRPEGRGHTYQAKPEYARVTANM